MDAKQLQDEADKAAAEAKRLHELADKEKIKSSSHANDGDEVRAQLEESQMQKLEEQAATLEQKAQEASQNSAAVLGLAAQKMRERDAYKREVEKKLEDMDREINMLTGGGLLL